MQNVLFRRAIRKLVATFVATMFTAIVMAGFMVLDDSSVGSNYNLGNQLIVLSLIIIIYAGVIILIYGNVVSIGLEWAQNKSLSKNYWVYILLHGFFGSAPGLLFQNGMFMLFGGGIALGYAGIDRWLSIRVLKQKGIKWFILIPILIYGIAWGCFQMISSPLPPLPAFTKEDAVEFATAGKGTEVDDFPDRIGTWQEIIIDGFHVKRETNAEEIANEKYIVTFTETWSIGGEVSSRFFLIK
ncbi:hypothetical protein Back11_56770 [Paenibacillus baekrokdamisoli]|uniref:Uncharacterized protein n=1 Tax=Paenibacillus baekrokdamisoli TaxID=1712516 RepID=A0A3G9J1A1_9BACL|nr:hypothetical protein [Paenibacillus baekrokdamisoli]BBH24332.1 hypothetical protein Back11_56770 [Paenibacillus baekrokdamisoli]